MGDKTKGNKLYDELQGQLIKDDVQRIKDYLHNNPLTPNVLENCGTSFTAICRELVKEKKIIPDALDFTFLEEMFKSFQMLTLIDIVHEFVANAKEAREDSSGGSSQSVIQSGVGINAGNFPTIQARSVTINQTINIPPTKSDSNVDDVDKD
ncbi:uncharacterized protein LOC135499531 [Lineus longissimus]|uniref:uncharacterized protein LOC135499531 n=1 Tax=Lineus longissimus TaxID=88925 RepID=UPI002B4D7E1A